MRQIELVTLNMRELDRLKVVQAIVETGLKPGRAAERLGLSVRQVERLVNRYRASGAAGLCSGRRDRPGNRKLDEGLAVRALTIIRERYADFGPTLACEKLHECHGITLSKETVRHLMTDARLWIPRRQRPPKIYQPRARRACLGELVQIDGSDHRWFEDRAPACTLLVYVDDATSRLMVLHFTATESTFSYFEATRGYLERYGKPVAFYSDRASTFHCNRQAECAGKGVTHFGRAMYELRADGAALPCIPYDRLAVIGHGEVIEHKRLGHALQVAQALQAQRDDRRASGSPSRTNHGVAVRAKQRVPGTKKQREFTREDVNAALTAMAAPPVKPVMAAVRRRPGSARSR
jgi:transposase